MSPPLIRPGLRRYAAAAMVLGALLTGVLGAVVLHGSTTAFDTAISRSLYRHLGVDWQLGLLGVSDSRNSFALLTMIVLVAALNRSWQVAALAVVGPTLALVVTEWVLKPTIARATSGAVHVTGSYPSGHETGVTSTALVIIVVCGQLRMPRWGRALLALGMLAWAVLAAVGLVRGFLHYATDTFGALGVSTVLVLGTALVLDRISSPAARNPPSTSRAA